MPEAHRKLKLLLTPGFDQMGGWYGAFQLPYAFPIWVETDDPFASASEVVTPFDWLD